MFYYQELMERLAKSKNRIVINPKPNEAIKKRALNILNKLGIRSAIELAIFSDDFANIPGVGNKYARLLNSFREYLRSRS